ncbi:hypothetical protein LE181_19330 [Streptomyces sp. SCA3-4]|uniref:hypothetical protein n=1 Tax=Streptomyces sichuanensis TaxID=2871810 RepID=UPI001CE23552|nr:hypothetical protein [Streptomyces sichuanensis]MCA6094309.1 hypothetical protein [Streptomyces sichuanensis]
MLYRIGLVLQRTLTHLLALLLPASGVRGRGAMRPPRAGHRTGPGAATVATRPAAPHTHTTSGLRFLIRTLTPPWLSGTPGSRAALTDLTPFFRPYYLTHEQRWRRTALALALDGIDIGPWVIHGHRIGAAALVPQAVAA